MVSSKNPEKKYVALLFIVMMMTANVLNSQNDSLINKSSVNSNQVWSDDAWQEATKDIHYEKEKEEEKKEKDEKELEDMNIDPSSTYNFEEILKSIFLNPLAKLITILIIIAMLIWLILKLNSARLQSGKQKVPEVDETDLNALDEKPMETDLERYLRLAIENGDYKTAVRVHYLIIIRALNEQHFIQWKKEKTNSDYLREMRHRQDYKRFRDLTLLYEIVWYGDRDVVNNEYTSVSKTFTEYQLSLVTTDEK